jgi:putative effector of murein hydrolase LrgA (UPF0299 family)
MKGQPSGRVRDAAVLLPLLGLVLFVPPVITLFAKAQWGVAGVPLIVVYVFTTWIALIGAAAALARKLE